MIVLVNERTKVVIYPVTAKSLVEIFAFCGVRRFYLQVQN